MPVWPDWAIGEMGPMGAVGTRPKFVASCAERLWEIESAAPLRNLLLIAFAIGFVVLSFTSNRLGHT